MEHAKARLEGQYRTQLTVPVKLLKARTLERNIEELEKNITLHEALQQRYETLISETQDISAADYEATETLTQQNEDLLAGFQERLDLAKLYAQGSSDSSTRLFGNFT